MTTRSHRIFSPALQELLGEPPSFLVRGGVTSMLLALSLLAICSWFVRHPEVVVVPFQVTTDCPPVRLEAQRSGSISELLVRANQIVDRDDVLAIIDSRLTLADYRRMSAAARMVEDHFSGNNDSVDVMTYVASGQHTALQRSYAGLTAEWNSYVKLVRDRGHSERLALLGDQLEQNRQLMAMVEGQIDLIAIKTRDLERQLEVASTLLKQGHGSQTEVTRIQSQLADTRLEAADLEIDVVELRSRSADITLSITSDAYERRMKLIDLELEAVRAAGELRSELAEWSREHLLIAPSPGRVSFGLVWSADQHVRAGDGILTILPNSDSLIAKATIPIGNSGRVKVGMMVKLMFDGFPYETYGAVSGEITQLSYMPSDGIVVADLALRNGLLTDRRQQLEFQPMMMGEAQIVVANPRLFEIALGKLVRVFGPLGD